MAKFGLSPLLLGKSALKKRGGILRTLSDGVRVVEVLGLLFERVEALGRGIVVEEGVLKAQETEKGRPGLVVENLGKEYKFELVPNSEALSAEMGPIRTYNWYGFLYKETELELRLVQLDHKHLVPYRLGAKNLQRPSVAVIEAAVDPTPYKILPDLELFLGSQDAAANLDTLKSYGITDVLNVGGYWIEYENAPTITYHNLPILDVPEADILPIFTESYKLINLVLLNGGKILVHCNAGVSRSTSVVLAYLMKKKGLSFEEALVMTKKAKPDIKPNEGFAATLKTRWAEALK